ncbi:hypothetical protein M080_4386 [Bacteroides fragilis str. 3397 T10]|nr:hypothetical protein M080_4386 [Bacteroides fragilis str. 3397 T10]
MYHLVEERPVKRFPGLELSLFWNHNHVLRYGIIGIVLVQRFDGANPQVVPNHRIDGSEAEMFPVSDFRSRVLSFQLFPQFRACLL